MSLTPNEATKKKKAANHSRISSGLENLYNSHTIFFALFPPIALYAINLTRFPGDHIIRSMFVLLGIGAVLVLLGWIYFRDVKRATVLSSLILFFSTNYGHVYTGLGLFLSKVNQAFNPNDFSVIIHLFLTTIWIVILIMLYRISTKGERLRRATPQFLFLLSLLTFLIPSVRTIWNWGRIRAALSESSISSEVGVGIVDEYKSDPPDVYYIFLDGYGREDILQEFFGYDNSYFLEELSDLGFYVADRSRSNYSNTITSLASTFNMNYLEGIADLPSEDLLCRMVLTQSIEENGVMGIFRELGYDIYAFSTGFPSTEITSADVYLQPAEIGLNPFESLLVRNSILLPLFDISSKSSLPLEYPSYSGHRRRIAFALEQLPQLSNNPGPQFVFAHIVAPHPPFVFDSKGNPTKQTFPFAIWDGDMFQGTYDDYLRGYTNQVTYLNHSLLNWVRMLLSDQEPLPIIILQGDHGPRSTVEWRNPSEDAMREGTAILNAYFLPGIDHSVLHDQITPVNTFRIVLNEFFDAQLDLLPDRTFFMSTGCQDFSYELK